MADHLSFVEVTCVLQWQGVKNTQGPTHRILYFIWLMMHYVYVCGCVRRLFFHWTNLRFEIKNCYEPCAIEDHMTVVHSIILQFPTTINAYTRKEQTSEIGSTKFLYTTGYWNFVRWQIFNEHGDRFV